MSAIGGTVTTLGGAGLVGFAAYSFQQHGSGKLHEKQEKVDAAIAENAGKPATIEQLRENRPSDFDVNFDKSLILGGAGAVVGGAAALMTLAGYMDPMGTLPAGTGKTAAVALGLLGGTAVGVGVNLLSDRFD